MNTGEHRFKHGDITQKVIGVFYEVYNDLGYGFLESVYQKALGLALTAAGLRVCSPIKISVWFRGIQVGYFEGDMLVENCVLLELKATRALDSSHQAQLLNYLRATDVEAYYLTSGLNQNSRDFYSTISEKLIVAGSSCLNLLGSGLIRSNPSASVAGFPCIGPANVQFVFSSIGSSSFPSISL